MISRWHMNVYWYVITLMCIFLVFLMLPDRFTPSSGSGKSISQQMNNLADQNSKATSIKERAQLSHKYNSLMKQKSRSVASSDSFSLVPLKIFLILVMSLMVYFVIQETWHRHRTIKVHKEA